MTVLRPAPIIFRYFNGVEANIYWLSPAVMSPIPVGVSAIFGAHYTGGFRTHFMFSPKLYDYLVGFNPSFSKCQISLSIPTVLTSDVKKNVLL